MHKASTQPRCLLLSRLALALLFGTALPNRSAPFAAAAPHVPALSSCPSPGLSCPCRHFRDVPFRCAGRRLLPALSSSSASSPCLLCLCLLPLPPALAFCLLPLASCLLLLAICCPLLPLFPLPLPRCLAPWTSPNPRPPRWLAMRGARRHSSCSAFARVRLPTRGTRPYTPCSSVLRRGARARPPPRLPPPRLPPPRRPPPRPPRSGRLGSAGACPARWRNPCRSAGSRRRTRRSPRWAATMTTTTSTTTTRTARSRRSLRH